MRMQTKFEQKKHKRSLRTNGGLHWLTTLGTVCHNPALIGRYLLPSLPSLNDPKPVVVNRSFSFRESIKSMAGKLISLIRRSN